MLTQAERLNDITNSLFDLSYTGSEIGQKEEVRIDELLWDLKKHFDEKLHTNQIDIQMRNLPQEQESIRLSVVRFFNLFSELKIPEYFRPRILGLLLVKKSLAYNGEKFRLNLS